MSERRLAPYGAWKSPITSDLFATGSMRLSEILLDGSDTYWIEGRASEGGRSVIVRRTSDGSISDVTPPGFNARTRVHEYGGGAYTVHRGTVYFSNFQDNLVYVQKPGEAPRLITTDSSQRFADFIVDERRNRLICVCEDHTKPGKEAKNMLVAIPLDGSGELKVLAEGNDFYGYARLSPDGGKLAWLTWNHPNMPWDGTELWIADVSDDGNLLNEKKVAGGTDESIFQPEWSPNGTLYFVSDKTDWWNLYRVTLDGVEQVIDTAAEFGVPQWVFGLSTYAIASEERIVCTFTEHGFWRLAAVDTVEKKLEVIETPYTYIEGIRATGERVVFRAASPTEFVSIVQLDLAGGQLSVLKKSCDLEVDTRYISTPKPVEYPTENGLTAYGIYYPPHNADFCAPDGELPPLLVNSHGGPTGAYQAVLSLETQYWTSRGFGVFLVNYGGSTGYGRSYRDRLKGNWGVVDVDDCVNGAKYLAAQGEVDVNRVVIAGGSAGGYTTVCALTFRDFFKAGASYFGISDLEYFARDTHKFESRYLDSLVGPYPERKDVYYERSATHFTDRLSCPIIFFQGLDDKIVPPNQSEIMVEALRKKGLPVAYLEFEGEGHGFRKAETLKRSLDAEFYFYARIFGLEPADEIEPVEIENLE